MSLTANKLVLFSILAIFFFTVLFLSAIDSTLLWDENAYLGNARALIGHSNYTEDFKFPLLNFVLGGVWIFTGESIFVAKFVIMLFGALSILVFHLIPSEYFENKKNLLLTSAFAFSYLVIYWSLRVYTDIPGMFFIMLSFYFLLKATGTGRKHIFLSGISSGLSFLMRFPFGLFPFSVIAYFIWKRKFPNILVFLFSIAIVLIPWASYNYFYHSGDPLYDLKNQWSIVYSYTSSEPITNHLANLILAMNALALFLPFGFYKIIKYGSKMRFVVLLYLLMFVAYFFFLSNIKLSRYIITALPFLYLVAGEGLSYAKKFACPVIVASIIISVFTFGSFIGNSSHCNSGGPVQNSVDYVCAQNPGKVASNFWPYFGYGCNVKVVGLWDNLVDSMLVNEKPDYLVYSPQYGEAYNKTALDNNPKLKPQKNFTGPCGESVFIYKIG